MLMIIVNFSNFKHPHYMSKCKCTKSLYWIHILFQVQQKLIGSTMHRISPINYQTMGQSTNFGQSLKKMSHCLNFKGFSLSN